MAYCYVIRTVNLRILLRCCNKNFIDDDDDDDKSYMIILSINNFVMLVLVFPSALSYNL